MKVRWRFRCYPTPEQERQLARTFGCCRFVYNWGLAERTKAFRDGSRMNYAQSSAELTKLKKTDEHNWLNEVSCVPVQQSLRNLQSAFSGFFDKRTRYPSFKKKSGRQSAEYTRSAFKFEVGNQRLLIAKIGRLKVKFSRRVEVQPSTVTIIREPSGKYFVSMIVDIQPEQFPKTGESVGVDFGISRLATFSTGEKVANPRFLRKHQARLKRAQQSMARKQKGSNRRKRAAKKVACIHEKIANCRKDKQKKLARSLVERFDCIYVEDLNLRGMVKNHNLARSLSDAAIGTCIREIETKAAMHGKHVKKIDRWFPSSKMCSVCGALQESLPLSVREWKCSCGAEHDRDLNAALNILAVGQTVSAHGDGVRAASASVDGPSVCEV